MEFALQILLIITFTTIYVIFSNGVFLALLLFVIVVPVISFAVSRFFRNKISAEIDASGSISKDEEAKVSITVKNSSIYPFSRLKGILTVNNLLTGELTKRKVYFEVPLKGENRADISLKCKSSGDLEISIESFKAFELFGIYSSKLDISEKKEVLVTTNYYDIETYLPFSSIFNEDTERYSQDKKGNDISETFQIREYIEGDSPASVHWKLSSKHDNLIVKEGSLPLTQKVFVYWDRSNTTSLSSDAQAEFIVSLSISLLKNGSGVKIAYFDEKKMLPVVLSMETEDELYPILQGILKASPCSYSGVGNYISLYGQESYVIYVASSENSDSNMLCSNENVMYVIIDDDNLSPIESITLY